MKTIWIILISVVVSGGLIGGGTYYLSSQKFDKDKKELNTTLTNTQTRLDALSQQLDSQIKAKADSDAAAETAAQAAAALANKYEGWKSESLGLTKSQMKYPGSWTMDKDNDVEFPKQVNAYWINKTPTSASDGYMAEINTTEWIKGVPPDAGYYLTIEKRVGLLAVIKELYSAGKLTDDLKAKFSSYAGEFMTFTAGDRIYVNYLESNSGKAKGISMINTHGQDVGLTSEYYAFLYNQEKNSILSIRYTLKGSEIDKIRDSYGDYTSKNLETIDKKAHTDFANLINNTKRADLSFGSTMDQIDNAIKSWAY